MTFQRTIFNFIHIDGWLCRNLSPRMPEGLSRAMMNPDTRRRSIYHWEDKVIRWPYLTCRVI